MVSETFLLPLKLSKNDFLSVFNQIVQVVDLLVCAFLCGKGIIKKNRSRFKRRTV
jgi:hypothetical protein